MPLNWWELEEQLMARYWAQQERTPVMSFQMKIALLEYIRELESEIPSAEVWDGNNQAVLERIVERLKAITLIP